MKIFIDTSAFYAMFDIDDALHEKSIKLLNKIPDTSQLFTSSEVIGETLTLLSMRIGKSRAVEIFKDILTNVETIMIDIEVFNNSLERFVSIKSKNISFVDCTSFVICKKLKIDFIFGFDKDFRKEGFKLFQ
jgi:predicted nucleic acid-binding protein